jgi:hypothetical protein
LNNDLQSISAAAVSTFSRKPTNLSRQRFVREMRRISVDNLDYHSHHIKFAKYRSKCSMKVTHSDLQLLKKRLALLL